VKVYTFIIVSKTTTILKVKRSTKYISINIYHAFFDQSAVSSIFCHTLETRRSFISKLSVEMENGRYLVYIRSSC